MLSGRRAPAVPGLSETAPFLGAGGVRRVIFNPLSACIRSSCSAELSRQRGCHHHTAFIFILSRVTAAADKACEWRRPRRCSVLSKSSPRSSFSISLFLFSVRLPLNLSLRAPPPSAGGPRPTSGPATGWTRNSQQKGERRREEGVSQIKDQRSKLSFLLPHFKTRL